MRKEIREGIEITIYTQAEKEALGLSPCFVEGEHFNDYITQDDYIEVKQAKTAREAKERAEALKRTPEEIKELKAKLEKLEDRLFFINMADMFDMVAYYKVSNEIRQIKEILKANA